ncbi:uncharacterized protein VTP21DRAFT_1865 [Calcarisporiella thermophila]|uniref:uncharacterized protein n=1 Tax=Calcarisporiella thermophila TaxID=911321 RepID=UPI003742033F
MNQLISIGRPLATASRHYSARRAGLIFLGRNYSSILEAKSTPRDSDVKPTEFEKNPHELDFTQLDKKWASRWREKRTSQRTEHAPSKGKYYILSMFPYPSGNLHMGHVRVYTMADTLARFRRQLGYHVINPMGWDAFGLPAENAAIERGIPPADWTKKNIASMKEQLGMLLQDFDWEREVATCDPSYYKWTQYLFLKMYHAGLAYQKEAFVNWDPVDQTVLANEQVDSEGRSWRSGALVEQKKLKQWFFKTTEMAEGLLSDLALLDGWPDKVKLMQKQWIGKSVGAEFDFNLKLLTSESPEPLRVFTSRPDTIFGVQYLAISPEHPLISERYLPGDRAKLVTEFVENMKQLNEADKPQQGFFTGLHAVHPITNQEIPIYVAPYVLSDYGTGAVMGVPAHDERDWAFAHKNGIVGPDVQVKYVVEPKVRELSNDLTATPFTGQGILNDLCQKYAGLASDSAMEQVVRDAEKEGFGRKKIQYRLRDWLLSRQRYWGAPIPMIHCQKCDIVPVPEDQLPVLLPENVQFTGKGASPLKQTEDWVKVKCPSCGGDAHRDTDTMDTFVDSSWYFLRYTDPKNEERPFSPDQVSSLMPVDVYIGGVEHAILHLLYARFFSKFIYNSDMCVASPEWEKLRGEPFKELLTQGMVHNKTFKEPSTGRYLKPEEVDLTDPSNPKIIATGELPLTTFEKMSKSKYNGIDPKAMINAHGADCTRLSILCDQHPTDTLEWEDRRVTGMRRWANRVWRLVKSTAESLERSGGSRLNTELNVEKMAPLERATYLVTNKTIQNVTNDFSTSFGFNTAIASLIELTNYLTPTDPTLGRSKLPSGTNREEKTAAPSPVFTHAVISLVKMIAPMAPALGEECWEALRKGSKDEHAEASVFESRWPELDKLALQEEEVRCAVQINGKVRFVITLPSDIVRQQEAMERAVRDSEGGKKWIGDRPVARVVHVGEGKLINFVLAKK